jgi:hypothetical protein
MRTLVIAWCALGLSGCGYFVSGSWEDDPQNWERAFGAKRPATVVVVHSRYWRSPHWSVEYEYFFQLKGDPQSKKEIAERYDLELAQSNGASGLDGRTPGTPGWFCVGPPGSYEAWRPRERAASFRMYVDRGTGDLFLTDQQL